MQDQDKIFGLIAQAEDIQKHALALQRSAQDAVKTLPDASRAAVRDAAKEFIAFTLQPQQQKVYSSNIAYGPANKKAVMLLDPALSKDMPTTKENIANQVAMDVTFWADYGEQLEQRFNAWAAK